MKSLVVISGLGGHALESWKSPTSHNVWLRDFLPTDLERVRTIIYEYNTDLRKGDWKTTIYRLAQLMLEDLRQIRDNTVSYSTHLAG